MTNSTNEIEHTCGHCWWADFNEDSPTKHKLHHEPDLFGLKKADDIVHDIRVIKVCGKNQSYFKTYGSEQPNPCPDFAEFSAEKAKFEDHVAVMRTRWAHPTNRTRLPRGANGFEMIHAMYENSNPAYDYMADLVAYGDKLFAKGIASLNDMNIRGEQIAIAIDYCGGIEKFLTTQDIDRQKLVDHVNATYKFAEIEEAVISGAHLYGHKLPAKKEA